MAYTGLPGRTPSRSGEAILTPAAAVTSLTGLNLSRGSLISSSGFGKSIAFAFVVITESLFARTMKSPFLRLPSIKIMFAVTPKPISSLTSSTMPFVDFSCCSSFFCMYCWVKPTNTASSSGIPSPVRALTGTMDISFVKSLTL